MSGWKDYGRARGGRINGWSQGGVPLYINRLKQEFDDRITMFRLNIYIYIRMVDGRKQVTT